jgi:rubrerythrin
MARLIDADKLKKHYAWWQGGTLEKTLDEMKRDFDTIIDLQPTVEAEPIKHGRWETVRAYPNVIMCSECNTPYERREFVAIPNYCPNCGARCDL